MIPEASPLTNSRHESEVEQQEQEEEEEEEQVEETVQADENGPAHHPSPPPDELFDISTTVDPGHIISLIRKLLPPDETHSDHSERLNSCDESSQREETGNIGQGIESAAGNGIIHMENDNGDAMEIQGDDLDGESDIVEHPKKSAREAAWEESGCILWDLAASKDHAEFMVQNLVIEVVLGNIITSDSARITEISLGILGNLACHEVLMDQVTSTERLVEIAMDQLFLDDVPSLCEVCRLLTSCIQGRQCATWAKALQPEHILSRLLWIAENTLNPQLIEKSVGLLLAIVENQQEAAPLLLPTLMKLGLPSILVNLLAFEMGKLTSERLPERYPAIDCILRAIEALSVTDDYSEEICSNKELFRMAVELVKIPEKIEIANSCITAAVLVANILADASELAQEMSKDLLFLQCVLDLFPFTSNDLEARNALWSILARLLFRIPVTELSPSSLRQYVVIFVSKSDFIEDGILDCQVDTSLQEHERSTLPAIKLSSITTAVKRIVDMLNQWNKVKDYAKDENSHGHNYPDDRDICRILDCCLRHTSSSST